MTPEQIKALAQLILDGLTWSQWPLYLLIFGVFVLYVQINGRLSAFATKSGEIDAITTRFDQLSSQLKINTEIVETVKSEIGNSDWATRELKTLRRLKLEELLRCASGLLEWQGASSRELIFETGQPAGESCIPQIDLIADLYLPELRPEIQAFRKVNSEFVSLTLEIHLSLIPVRADYKKAELIKDTEAMKTAHAEKMALITQYKDKSLHIHRAQVDAHVNLRITAQRYFVNLYQEASNVPFKTTAGRPHHVE